jgi:hypothetical protein
VSFQVNIEVQGMTGPMLARVSTGLRNRRALHTQIAGDAERYLKATGFKKAQGQHRSAERLGANPTGHLAKAYANIESAGTDEQAELRIPRASRLRAAFSDYVARPGAGKKFLTLPGHAETYGRRVGEFSEGTFRFAILQGARVYHVLLWAEDGGAHAKGDVAYWLKREVTIKQDATLIRFDLLAQEARDSAQEYLDELIREAIV